MKQKTSTLVNTALVGGFCCAGFRATVVDFEVIESLLVCVFHRISGKGVPGVTLGACPGSN